MDIQMEVHITYNGTNHGHTTYGHFARFWYVPHGDPHRDRRKFVDQKKVQFKKIVWPCETVMIGIDLNEYSPPYK